MSHVRSSYFNVQICCICGSVVTQTDTGAQPTSYPTSNEGSFPDRRGAGAAEVKNGGAIPQLPHTSS
jgi:hypothetical protein